MSKAHSVLILGAGIGGLATALALRQRGLEVRVFERAERLLPVGHAITLWPNAMAVLGRLGVAGDLIERGTKIAAGEFRTPRGRVLTSVDVAEASRRLGQPAICLRRSTLQDTLLEHLAPHPIDLGQEGIGVQEDPDGIELRFANGRCERASAVVAADGIHSRLRRALFGTAEACSAGVRCSRALVPEGGSLLAPGQAFEAWGEGLRFGAIGLERGAAYWFATEPVGPLTESTPSSLDLLARFSHWAEPVPALMRATPEGTLQTLEVQDLRPRRPWARGRAVLVGDAAHAMTPDLGQGGCQAIEDAWVLAECLAQPDLDVASALRRFESLRYARVRKLAQGSRRLNAIAGLRSPLLAGFRNLGMRLTPKSWMLQGFLAGARGGPA